MKNGREPSGRFSMVWIIAIIFIGVFAIKKIPSSAIASDISNIDYWKEAIKLTANCKHINKNIKITQKDRDYLEESIKAGLVPRPKDENKFMMSARIGELAMESWANKVLKMKIDQTLLDDGFPNFQLLYPFAVKHYAKYVLNNLNMTEKECNKELRKVVGKASVHFIKYHRENGKIAKNEKDGSIDWPTVYMQINNHFTQCMNGKVSL